MADEAYYGKRKSKTDKRKKRRHGIYKRGGKYRSTDVEKKK